MAFPVWFCWTKVITYITIILDIVLIIDFMRFFLLLFFRLQKLLLKLKEKLFIRLKSLTPNVIDRDNEELGINCTHPLLVHFITKSTRHGFIIPTPAGF